MIGGFSLASKTAVRSPLASAIQTSVSLARTVTAAPAPAPGVDLRAPAPAPQPVIPILFKADAARPSQVAPLAVPAMPRTMPAIVPASAPAPEPAALPVLPVMALSPAPSAAPAAFASYEDVLPEASGGAPEFERASGGGDAPALRPASTVGVKVDAPDWAWIGGAALVVGGIGLWLYRRKA